MNTLLLFAQSSDYDRGVALFDKGDHAAAVPYLRRAVEGHPQDAQAWKALGVAYAAQNLYRDAEPPFRRACNLNPKLEGACYYLGRTLYSLDQYEASLKALERAPQSWKVRLGVAQDLEALGKAPEAEREFRAVLAVAGGDGAQPGVALGLFLVRRGRFEEAIPAFEEVLKRFPSAADAHLHLGRALLEQGRLDIAVPHLERAVALDPGSTQAHLLLAKAYVRSGRPADAQPHFDVAAKSAR